MIYKVCIGRRKVRFMIALISMSVWLYLCLDVNVFRSCITKLNSIECDSGEEIQILWGYCTFLENCDDGGHLPHCIVNQTSRFIHRCNGKGEVKCNVGCLVDRPSNCNENEITWINVGYLCKFVTVYCSM